MRTKNQQNKQRQRELILNAAWELFCERGYKNVTLEDILQSAACSALRACSAGPYKQKAGFLQKDIVIL